MDDDRFGNIVPIQALFVTELCIAKRLFIVSYRTPHTVTCSILSRIDGGLDSPFASEDMFRTREEANAAEYQEILQKRKDGTLSKLQVSLII